jgi:ATP-dependent Lon protease
MANLKDLDKIDMELRKKVQFYPVSRISEVLNIAFPGVLEKPTPKL